MMKPRMSYVVFGVQRSGTSLLCECLKRTGLAGVPEEYFLPPEDGGAARQGTPSAAREYLDTVLAQGTTPNGVFGAKIMWNYRAAVVAELRRIDKYRDTPEYLLLQTVFPQLHCIWMIRRDKVRQAVSWAKAGQTGIYASHQAERQKPRQEAVFDFRLIDNLHRLILEGEAGWQNYFRECGASPFTVFYEDLAACLEVKTIEVLEYLGLGAPKDFRIENLPLTRQSDSLNDEWAQKYIEMKRAEPRP